MPPPETGRWDEAGTVQNFSTAGPNRVLLEFVRVELARCPELRILDVGCGAARNAAPIRHAPVAAEVSEEHDGRRTVSFRLPSFPPEPTR